MEFLLYKNDLPEETLARLSAEGVVAIQTNDFDDFKFLQVEPATVRTDDFTWALLDALRITLDKSGVGANRLLYNLAKLADDERGKRAKKVEKGASDAE